MYTSRHITKLTDDWLHGRGARGGGVIGSRIEVGAMRDQSASRSGFGVHDHVSDLGQLLA
jgi:hypothetical protein